LSTTTSAFWAIAARAITQVVTAAKAKDKAYRREATMA
jgi:hypothetical protein